MKILIFSWRGPKHPHAGGAEIATLEHALAWVKEGHEVVWFTSIFKLGLSHEKFKGIEIIRQGNQILGVQLMAFYWYCFKNKYKFDLVIDQFHGLPFFTPLYVKTNILGFIHEVAKDIWQLNQWQKPFNIIPSVVGPVIEPYFFKIIYKNTRFMTVSESTKKDLMDWGVKSKNIHIVLNGIHIIKPLRKIKKEIVPTIIFLGAVAKDKGIMDAIEVFKELSIRFNKIQFWIVGKSSPEIQKEIKVVINKNKLSKKIKMWGFVGEKKKFELLKRSHILVNPSVREGWGLVNVEASAMGVPVVAYNVPGCKDSILNNKTGLLVKFKSINEFVSAIESLLVNKDLYTQFSKNSINWSKNFTWKKSTKQSSKLLEKYSL